MLLLHSQSFPHYGLERFFQFAKDAGFDGVEIMINENFDTQSPSYLKKLEERFGLPIKAFSLPSKKEEELYMAFQETVKEFNDVVLNLTTPQSFAFKYKKWINNTVPQLCQKCNLRLNFRNAPAQMMLGMIPQRNDNSLFSLKEKGHVCLDLSALWANKEEIMKPIGFLGDKLRHVYLSNVHKNLAYSPLPTGVLPLESFLRKLAQMHYSKDFTLVLSPSSLHEGEDAKLLEILKESKQFFADFFTNAQAVNTGVTE
ncbi:sugar phosphate isomerase/epimerase [Candidatus Gracilibacteria bacterium]|nr:sugar phosphate isomerase/epimerase [Candidatus Gracilibacteria bacterium]